MINKILSTTCLKWRMDWWTTRIFAVECIIVPLGSVECSTIECDGEWCVVKTDSRTAPMAVSLALVVRMRWEPGWWYASVVESDKRCLTHWNAACWCVPHVSSYGLSASVLCRSAILSAAMGMKR